MIFVAVPDKNLLELCAIFHGLNKNDTLLQQLRSLRNQAFKLLQLVDRCFIDKRQLSKHKFLDAEKFNLRFSDASEITEIADKLRWYRYQKGLRQRDAADYAGIDRSTYIHYEEAGRDFYPKEYMEKLAELFEVPLEDLLDDYNLFLLRGQGAQIKAIRQRLGLTQKAYAAQLGVPLQKFKRWEQGTVQIFKSTWEKYFKKM